MMKNQPFDMAIFLYAQFYRRRCAVGCEECHHGGIAEPRLPAYRQGVEGKKLSLAREVFFELYMWSDKDGIFPYSLCCNGDAGVGNNNNVANDRILQKRAWTLHGIVYWGLQEGTAQRTVRG